MTRDNKITATYSPEDNKIRLYSATRLGPETYARVTAAGYRWAPRQGFFVAPMWTPQRADLAMDLAGEIGDEDTSLAERAQDRAERYDDLSTKRADDAQRAQSAVSAISDGIPFGQPILVGHHSERHARKRARQIDDGLRKAVSLWESSQYWKDRAAGALRHAKYKVLPAVRSRRIKSLEADKRKQEKIVADAEAALKLWRADGLTHEKAKTIASYYDIWRSFTLADYPRDPPASQYEGIMSLWSALDGGVITAEQARDIAIQSKERVIAWSRRWILHYENRITYERAMLADQGGIIAESKGGPEVGGAIKSLWGPRGGWAYIKKVNKITVQILHQWSEGGRVFAHNEPMDKIDGIMSKAEVDQAREEGRIKEAPGGVGFWLMQGREELKPLAEDSGGFWEELPRDTFAGT